MIPHYTPMIIRPVRIAPDGSTTPATPLVDALLYIALAIGIVALILKSEKS